MYQIAFARQAEKSLKKFPVEFQERIKETIAGLAYNPLLGKKLAGRYKNDYSMRVWPYRIIYSINNGNQTIEIYEIEHRSQAYRR